MNETPRELSDAELELVAGAGLGRILLAGLRGAIIGGELGGPVGALVGGAVGLAAGIWQEST